MWRSDRRPSQFATSACTGSRIMYDTVLQSLTNFRSFRHFIRILKQRSVTERTKSKVSPHNESEQPSWCNLWPNNYVKCRNMGS